MNRVFLVVLISLTCAFLADSSSASIISPSNVTYQYYDWDAYPYYYGRPDNTGDDLANGYLNGPAGDADLENADWVEFINGGAHIVFDLGAVCDLDSVSIGYFLAPTWGLPGPSSLDVSYSNDLVTFTAPVNMTGFQSIPDNGWVAETVTPTFSLAGNQARYVSLLIHAATPEAWMFLGEFTFSQVPEPATMLLLGIGGLSMLRRKK